MSDFGICQLQRNIHTQRVNLNEIKQENIYNGRNNLQM